MTHVLLYEFITGGGLYALGDEPPAGSLLAEGAAMRSALAADLLAAGHATTLLSDARLPAPRELAGARLLPVASAAEERDRLQAVAAEADLCLLIAPETAGLLAERTEWALSAGGRLASPGPEFIRLASDKHALAERLAAAGLPTPRGLIWQGDASSLADLRFPLVAKPNDGCGSQGVRLLGDRCELAALPGGQRVEEFRPGLPASIAALCGPRETRLLPACQQRLSGDGRFQYLGGRVPLSAPLCRRAERLAAEALAALPPTVGYVGFDLVLGAAEDGRGDAIIEANPRLTTSYVGLRALAAANLAEAMLAIALGAPARLSWREHAVEFAADGGMLAPPGSPSLRTGVP